MLGDIYVTNFIGKNLSRSIYNYTAQLKLFAGQKFCITEIFSGINFHPGPCNQYAQDKGRAIVQYPRYAYKLSQSSSVKAAICNYKPCSSTRLVEQPQECI